MKLLLEKLRSKFEIHHSLDRSMLALGGDCMILFAWLVYWAVAALIAIVCWALSLLLSTSLPRTLGVILVALEGLLFEFCIRPDSRLLATYNDFSTRLKKMKIGQFANRAQIQDDFREREGHRSKFLRCASDATSTFLVGVGVLFAVLSEAM